MMLSEDERRALEDERRALLDEIYKKFKVELLCYGKMSNHYRDDVSLHGFFSRSNPSPSKETKQEVRKWVESQGWQFSRQLAKDPINSCNKIERIYLAPMRFVEVERGYHATRRASVPSIQAKGLLPSTPEWQTTEERRDCEGNIYICEILGTPEDAGVQGSKSAHWWRGHLAEKNRFNDPDWVILELESGKVCGAKLYRDIWSDSGIIVGGVDAIPPEVIRVVYQPPIAGPE